MAINYSPKIVTDGLVLCLDAANPKSYPGTGTAWTDLSGNGNDATLVNGPTYSSEDNGSIVFDGTNDNAITGSFSDDSNLAFSVFCWVYPIDLTLGSSGGTYLNWIINKRNTTSPNANQWQFLAANSYPVFQMWDSSSNSICGTTTEQISESSSPLQLGVWQNIGITTTGANGGELKIYINGVVNYSGTLTGDRGLASKPLAIGRTGWPPGALMWDGHISNTSIYNRALSAEEVQQNFNATRGRYGI